MKQIVNHPDQQFYSFDSYLTDNGLEKYFTLSYEFDNFNSDLWAENDDATFGVDNDDTAEVERYEMRNKFYNVTAQKKKNRKRILTRILTGGASTLFESKEQRKATNEQIKADAKDKKLRQVALAVATGGASLTATKEGRKMAGKLIKKNFLGVPFLAYIGLVRVNMAKQAARMYPGLLTEQEAKDAGYDIANWKKTVALVKKVEKILEKWGGAGEKDKALFRKAIKQGHDKPPFRSRARAKREKAAEKAMADRAKAQNNNFVSAVGSDTDWFNYEGIWEAVAVAAGSAILGIVAGVINKAGVKKNPYSDGKVHPGLEGEDEEIPTASPEQQAEAMREMIEQDSSLTPEQKEEALEAVDSTVAYLNDPKIQAEALKAGDSNDDLLLYGGIALGVIAISAILYFAFKPKTKAA